MAVTSSETEAVMVRFQETMTHFLETQRQMMMAYLGATKAVLPTGTRPLEEATAPVANIAPKADAVKPAVAVEPQPQHAEAQEGLTIRDRLRGIISDRTGYPIEMLQPALNLEADLGIDSIKRVEILGAFQRSCNADDQQKLRGAMENLTSLKTIGDLAGTLGTILGTSVLAETGAAVETKPAEALPRFVLTVVKAPAATFGPSTLPKGVVLITDDGRGVASTLASELRRRGWPVAMIQVPDVSIRPDQVEPAETSCVDISQPAQVERLIQNLHRAHGRVAGVLHLLPLTDWAKVSWQRRLELETKGLFHLAKAAGSDLRARQDTRAILLAATCLGGDFGVAATSGRALSPVQGGVPGILKTLALEWPEVACEGGRFPKLAWTRREWPTGC